MLQNYIKNDLFQGIVSRQEFLLLHNEGLIPSDTAIICIHDPDIEFHDKMIMRSYVEALQIRFWDIEEAIGKYTPITDEQGKLIRKFIERNKDRSFLVHCMAGQSRSAGVGCAIECIVNFNGSKYDYLTGASDVKKHERYSPNLVVFDAIIGS